MMEYTRTRPVAGICVYCAYYIHIIVVVALWAVAVGGLVGGWVGTERERAPASTCNNTAKMTVNRRGDYYYLP